MAEKKQKKVSLKLTAEGSFGHINHDSTIQFQFFDTGLWVSHCDAVLIWDITQVEKLIRFLEKNKGMVGKTEEVA